MRRTRHLLVAAAVATMLAMMLAMTLDSAVASAAVTSSNITTPGDPSFYLYDKDNAADPANTFTVAGTVTDNGTPANVDILCVNGASVTNTMASDQPVTYNGTSGTFSVPVTLTDAETGSTCTLAAVSTGTTPSNFSPYTGPRVGLGEYITSAYNSGPFAGQLYGYFINDSQLSGQADYNSFAGGGLYDGHGYGSTYMPGGDIFYANDTYEALTKTGVTRSSIQVDTANAYGAGAVDDLCGNSCSVAGVPTITLTHAFDPHTGNLVITESEPLVKCSPADTTYPPVVGTDCTGFAPTGVTVHRTITQTGGDQATIIDTYDSTDNAPHTVNLISLEDEEFSSAGYDFPWVDGTNYFTHTAGDTKPSPPTVPASVFLDFDNTLASGDPGGDQAAITFAQTPAFSYATSGDSGETHLTAAYNLTVPAGGARTVAQIFSWSLDRAAVQLLATAAQNTVHGPTLTISSPVNGTTVTKSPVTVSGTASATAVNGGLSSLVVNGHAVAVNPLGGWSTPMTLSLGANRISADATDGDGNVAPAAGTVYYAPPAVLKVNGRVRYASGTVQVPLRCVAGGSNCAGKLKLTTVETVIKVRRHKRHKVKVTLVLRTQGYSLGVGRTHTVKLKLNPAGSRLLTKLKSLKLSGTATVSEPAGGSTKTVRFSLTAHAPKPKPKKKHKKH